MTQSHEIQCGIYLVADLFLVLRFVNFVACPVLIVLNTAKQIYPENPEHFAKFKNIF